MSATTSLSQIRSTFAPVILALGLGLAALVALFWPEARAAVGVWMSSTAYGHCFLIVPMALYLAWDRRDAIAGITAAPNPAFAVLAIPAAAAWFLAERLGIMEGRQLAAILAVEVLVLTVLGWPLFRALVAPLAFLVFLVPFGAFATPWLQVVTARITAIGLDMLGIPNFVTDLTIEIPAGTFYVAEACAGLRFLIAAVAFGVFYALLNYQSPGRRLAFIAASVIVPIFANGLRALGIVVLGHVLGSAEAAAADHVLYGWIFFSIVMLLLVLAGLPLREPPAGPGAARHWDRPTGSGYSPWLAAAAVFAVLAVGPAATATLDRDMGAPKILAFPTLVVPAGCVQQGEIQATATLRAMDLLCGTRTLRVAMQAFSAGVKSDVLARERRRETGELIAEDVEYGVLRPDTAGAGPWSIVRTIDPFKATAVSSWVDGAPAQGGLTGRIVQARNSVLGTAYAPLLITASIPFPARLSPQDAAAVEALLTRFAAAQTTLMAQVQEKSKLIN